MDKVSDKGRLREIAGLFLKLGFLSFGGPAAHIAMMEAEVVKKRKWMDADHFLDLIGATNLIPGPNSTEMAMHCGHERAGLRGLVVAGVAFIFPAVLITSLFAWLYVTYGQLPEAEPFIYGIKPAVVAIIASAVITLGKKALKTKELYVLGTLCVVLSLVGVNEILALFLTGVLALLLYLFRQRGSGVFPVLLMPLTTGGVTADSLRVFLIFLKVGALLYGSGYVLFAFLDAELVATGLMSRTELIDAVAVGQFTPGPVLSTATFVGWILQGPEGALLATIGIFLPSFLLVALLNPLIPRMRKWKPVSAFLDGVNVGSVAVILAVCLQMGFEAVTDWRTTLIFLLGLLVVFFFKKVNSAWLVIGGSALGLLLFPY
ncbi:chromate efflux transporter [Bacteroides graminisolvens]|uniref:chromate efflux transporter n=1 Tax=Bacteroides graminisolvens TaxID=477666 RepID=UPI0023F2CE34|nr:chromate efflux transporter [Bacteroides graminisolvens]MDD3209839.1 chromate efflux transporter [Bacteroides graminisolvens]